MGTLDLLADLVISYDPGDLMVLTRITKGLKDLRAELGHPTALALLGALDGIAAAEAEQGDPRFSALLSHGLDLIRDVSEADGAVPEWKIRKAEAWAAETSRPGTPGEGAAETRRAPEALAAVDPDLLGSFAADSEERLARAQDLILALESNLEDEECVKELFRVFHTIKGECGFLKLANLGILAHNVENLLDLLRSGKLKADAGVIERLLEGLDLSKALLREVAEGKVVLEEKTRVNGYVDELSLFISGVKPSLGSILVENGSLSEEDLRDLVKEQVYEGFERKLGQVALEKKIISREDLERGLEIQKSRESSGSSREGSGSPREAGPSAARGKGADAVDPIMKVKSSKVNYLVDMIGELLISLGQVGEDVPGLAQVRKISRTLQYAGMRLRTESARSLFGTMRRVVRDVSAKLGKPVRVEFEGEDLEIDRNLIESLEEPLMHLVRNSMDHGIEGADERMAAGKLPEGLVRVTAERRGNSIAITVSDDGRGLDRELIAAKAVERGLAAPEAMAAMTDAVVYNFIFVSGFSTKEKADYVSGRGVGMDIVREMVAKAKGRIEISSERGKGASFALFFPLSTAIIDGMTVRAGGNVFIIPIASISESLKLRPGMMKEIKKGVTVLHLRGEIIPVIPLAEVFKLGGSGEAGMATIVEDAAKRRFAILSDEVIAKREVVIKSLGARFRDLKGISSGTVLSGGAIGLVIDVEQLIALGEAEFGASAAPAEGS